MFGMILVAISGMVPQALTPIWAPKGIADDADSYVAFRSEFRSQAGACELDIVGASEYLVWVDGKLVHDGPARFARAFPEYQTVPLRLAPGAHVLAVQVHNEGVTTRILSAMPPFLWCRMRNEGDDLPLRWSCARMPGYRSRTHRIGDILGWIDWCDTRQVWPNWTSETFKPSGWSEPISVDPGIGPITAARTQPVKLVRRLISPIAEGKFATAYGYEADEPSARFFLDDLSPKSVPPQGVWRRYDLGRIRLGRPKLTIDAPAGSIIEYGMSEQLRHDRVAPWITLSGSTTCNFDHFVARGGPQEFMPFTPKGGRYLEVHVKSDGPVTFVAEEFLERTFYDRRLGEFSSDDNLLNKIWRVGVETVQACSDDSLVDCPTRERGEWTGDVASVATDIAAVAFGDLSLSRRALVQASQVARDDGLVAGVGPGDPGYLSTYAAQWTTACVHYWELTGDQSLPKELYLAARKNMKAFENHLTAEGLDGGLGWGFVDWGYVGNDGPSDMALNLHYVEALRAMIRWDEAIGDHDAAIHDQETLTKISSIITRWLHGQVSKPGGWQNVGYQRAALALHAGLVSKESQAECVATIKAHLLSCFPNDPNGPRLSDPAVSNPRIMTPYFGHWAMAALIEHGEADFVLGQCKKCWGWALKDGQTTWMEVFDPRWSHCHEWSGCPTWQLTRYYLGLRARFDLGNVIEFQPVMSALKKLSGVLPLPNGDKLSVEWTRNGRKIRARFQSTKPVQIRADGKTFDVNGTREIELDVASTL